MTPDEELKKQVEDQEKKAKETIDSSIRIPLTEKQASILKKIALDKKKVEEEFARLGEKESDIVTFIFEFKQINQKDVKEIKLSELNDAMIVTMKPLEKKETISEDKKSVMEIKGEHNMIGDHNTQNNGIQKEGELKEKDMRKEPLKAK